MANKEFSQRRKKRRRRAPPGSVLPPTLGMCVRTYLERKGLYLLIILCVKKKRRIKTSYIHEGFGMFEQRTEKH